MEPHLSERLYQGSPDAECFSSSAVCALLEEKHREVMKKLDRQTRLLLNIMQNPGKFKFQERWTSPLVVWDGEVANPNCAGHRASSILRVKWGWYQLCLREPGQRASQDQPAHTCKLLPSWPCPGLALASACMDPYFHLEFPSGIPGGTASSHGRRPGRPSLLDPSCLRHSLRAK